jgi:hypothetical protein
MSQKRKFRAGPKSASVGRYRRFPQMAGVPPMMLGAEQFGPAVVGQFDCNGPQGEFPIGPRHAILRA